MEGRVHYLVVGIFVAAFIAGIMVFAFWLMKYGTYKQMQSYVVYFDESVAGLNKDAAVKYMGVDVGTVETIEVDTSSSKPVAVYLKIDHDVKIKTDAVATLKFYGMTGLAYVEITGHDPNAPLLRAENGVIPVIESAPYFYAQLDQALATIAEEFGKTSERIERLLSDQNLRHLTNTLTHIEAFSGALDTHKSDITALLQKATSLEERATRTLLAIDRATAAFGPGLGTEAKKALREIRSVARHLDKTLVRGDYNLRTLSSPTLEKLNRLIEKLTLLSDQTGQTLRQIEQSPSDLLFKRVGVRPGPGEE
jgi:phospholipid/cholesterol/gamma-HCH transport system substrate-binding protein